MSESCPQKSPRPPPPICICLMMGLPASGKSTLVRKIIQEFSNNSSDVSDKTIKNQVIAVSFSYDSFIPFEVQKQCAENASKEKDDPNSNSESVGKMLRKKFLSCVKHVITQLQEQEETLSNVLELSQDVTDKILPNSHFERRTEDILQEIEMKKTKDSCPEYVFLIDDNHYYSSMRGDLFNLAKTLTLGFCILFVKASLKTCLQRNSRRSEEEKVPERSLIEMSLKLEEPSPSSNPFDAFCICIQNEEEKEEMNLPVILQVLLNAMKNPIKWSPQIDRSEEKERERRICSQNEVHQADQILRKWVNREIVMKSLGSANSNSGSVADGKKQIFKELNAKRVLALDKLRSGEVQVASKVEQDVEFTQEVLKLVMSLRLE